MAKSFDELVARTTSKKVQERAKRRARRYLAAMLLSELRELKGMSQKQLSHTLRIKQPSLSWRLIRKIGHHFAACAHLIKISATSGRLNSIGGR